MPPDRWDALWTAVDRLDSSAEHITWGGGGQVGTTVVDGVEAPVYQMPYAVYSDEVERLRGALGGVGAVVPFAWPDWHGIRTYRGGQNLDRAPVADAVRLLTAIIRSERFSDGSIAGALADGTLPAALSLLRRWHDQQLSGD